MALSLIEASKIAENDPLKSGIMETLAVSSELLSALPFENIQGSAIEYVQEKTLPSISGRAVNTSYTAGTGETQRLKASLKIMGGSFEVDKALIDMFGPAQEAVQIEMKTKALAGYIERQLLKGDSDSDPKTFDGLQKIVTSGQTITNGTAGLKLAVLDEAIDAVSSPNAIIMSKSVKRRLITASRNSSISGAIAFSLDTFGRQITSYNGIPIITVGKDNLGAEILDFGEASSSTSVYVASFGPGMYTGIQNGGVNVISEGLTHPYYKTIVEWYIAQAVWSELAVARIKLITDAAVSA
jgi:hypothetical protein